MTSEPRETGGTRSGRSVAARITRHALVTTGIPLLLATALVAASGMWLANRTDRQVADAQGRFAEETVGGLEASRARLVAESVDTFLALRLDDVVDLSRSPQVAEASAADRPEAADAAGLPDGEAATALGNQVLDTSGTISRLLAEQADAESFYAQLLAVDRNGFVLGAANPPATVVQRGQRWFTEALATGAWIGPLEPSDDAGGAPAIVVAARIDDPAGTGAPVGVVQAVVTLTAVQAVADANTDPAAGLQVMVGTAEGLVVADTATTHDPQVIDGVTPLPADRNPIFAKVLGATAASGYVDSGDVLGGYSRLTPTRRVAALGVDIPSPAWVAIVQQPTRQAVAAADELATVSDDVRNGTRLITLAVAGVALLGLLLAWLTARRQARHVVGPIEALRSAANRLAHHDLPALLRSSTGDNPSSRLDPVDVGGDKEVAELTAAFNNLRSTAVDLAATQAIDRDREVAAVLVNLGRRNQQLIGRQLRFIDDLERTESNPDTLRNLFALDQMATRMRRNAESLLVLAGEESPRRGTQPRPVDEVVRAATSEVEDFARVTIGRVERALVDPRAISDITHLLAELIENATLFSPPQTTVDVNGVVADDGTYTISIVDRGLGLSLDRLDEANARITSAPEAGAPPGSFMGLFVVGRLAARHGITVRLVESAPSGGITAKVTLPLSCLATGPEPVVEIRSSRLHVSGPLTGPPPSRASTPPPTRPVRRGPEPRKPERPGGSPEEEPAVVSAMGPGDDEAAGAPIPPFKSRPSRRIERDANGSDPEQQRFQVRRRVRKSQPVSGGQLGVVEAEAPAAAVTGTARAEEVRDKLNRFASGVEAARAQRQAAADPVNGSAGDDEEES
ncbi:MAG: ATP-binding protein [Acidimicrobiales bacterium]